MANSQTLGETRALLGRLPSYVYAGMSENDKDDVITDLIQLVQTLAQTVFEHEDDFTYCIDFTDLKETVEEMQRDHSWALDTMDITSKAFKRMETTLDLALKVGLKGDKGDHGERGQAGTTGPRGADGANGIDGSLDPSPLYDEQEQKMKDMQTQIDELTALVRELLEDEED